MAGEADLDRWKLLARMLKRRRYEIDPAYGDNLTLFAEERRIDYRLVWDIENVRRQNFKTGTLAEVARAYLLDTWSIEEFINDGTPLRPLEHNPYADDRALAEVWNASQGLEPEQRHGLVKLARDMREKGGNGGRRRTTEDRRRRA